MSKKHNIIFLDIDGPVIPTVYLTQHPDNCNTIYPGDWRLKDSMHYYRFDERFIMLWDNLNQTRTFKTVISSTWGKHYPESWMFVDLFKVNGLDIDLHDDWVTRDHAMLGRSNTRATEIHEWLEKHKEDTNDFLILDDEDSGHSLCHPVKDHIYLNTSFIEVSMDDGLSYTNIRHIKYLTESWKDV